MPYYYFAINIFLFYLFYRDKISAKRHDWRIKESTLLSIGLLGGAVGGFLGMFLFHHKIRKTYFFVVYILSVIIHPLFLYFILYSNI